MKAPRRTPKESGDEATPKRAAKRVLVVENHADTRRGLEMILEIFGYEVRSAADMRTALEIAATGERIDVLLSDIRLPDGDGCALLRRLEEMGQRPAQAVAMSGFSSAADIERSLAAGFQTHLIKPFPPEDLAGLLAQTDQS